MLQRGRGVSSSTARVVILGSILLACPLAALAQRHGGGQGVGTLTGAPGRPDGVDQKDSLRDFHEALAVQATSQQIAEFQSLMKNTQAAQTALRSLQQQLQMVSHTLHHQIHLLEFLFNDCSYIAVMLCIIGCMCVSAV